MGSDFRIDTEQARLVLRRIEESGERMEQARNRLKKVGPKTLGTEELDSACDTFQSEWEDGIKRIEDASKDIKDRLQTTIDAYRAGDDTNAKNFGKE